MIEQRRRRLAGLGFFALAGLLAWGGTVDPAKASARWIFVAALAGVGIVALRLRRLGRMERLYLQLIALGIAIGSVAWLIPANGSDALLAVAGLLILFPLALWAWTWFQNRQAARDDADRPR